MTFFVVARAPAASRSSPRASVSKHRRKLRTAFRRRIPRCRVTRIYTYLASGRFEARRRRTSSRARPNYSYRYDTAGLVHRFVASVTAIGFERKHPRRTCGRRSPLSCQFRDLSVFHALRRGSAQSRAASQRCRLIRQPITHPRRSEAIRGASDDLADRDEGRDASPGPPHRVLHSVRSRSGSRVIVILDDRCETVFQGRSSGACRSTRARALTREFPISGRRLREGHARGTRNNREKHLRDATLS